MNKRYNELNRQRIKLIKKFNKEIGLVIAEMNEIAAKEHGPFLKRTPGKR